MIGDDASTGQIVAQLALAFIIGGTIFAIRALRAIDKALADALNCLDIEDEEPLAGQVATGPWAT